MWKISWTQHINNVNVLTNMTIIEKRKWPKMKAEKISSHITRQIRAKTPENQN